MTRALFLWPVALLAACSTEESSRTAGAPDRVRLRVGYQRYVTYAPLFIAEAEGFFAAHGIDLEMIIMPDGNAGTPALVTGRLDVLAGPGTPGLLNAIARGAHVRLVADKGSIPRAGCSQLALIGRPGIDLAARAGPGVVRRVSPSRATHAFEYFVDRALIEAGVRATTLQTLHLPTPILADALGKARVDVVATTEPAVTRLVDAGNRVLRDAREVVPGLPYAFIVFGDRLIRRERDAGERFMRAYVQGVRQYARGKTPRNLDIVAQATGEDSSLLRRACWPPVLVTDIDSTAFGDFQDWAVARGILDRRLALKEYWDGSFLERTAAGVVPNAPGERRRD